MNSKKLDIKSLLDISKLQSSLQKLKVYSLPAFIALVAVLYGFLIVKIGVLSNTQPSQDAINSHVQAAKVLSIDQSVVDQLQSLKDNSVNVQSLFDQARNNPFQEN